MSSGPSARHPLVSRLIASLALVVLVVAGVGRLAMRAVERYAVDQERGSLVQAARLMEVEVLAALGDAPAVERVQPVIEALSQRAGCRVTVIGLTGTVWGDSEQTAAGVLLLENHGGRPEVLEALRGTVGTSLRYSATVRAPMLYVAWPLARAGATTAVLRLAVPATTVAEIRRTIGRTTVTTLAAGWALACLLGIWLARHLAAPLHRLTAAAAVYARGDFSVPAPRSSIREIQAISDSLTTMGRSLRQSFDALRAERHQARVIVESMAEGVVALDAQGRILLMNPAAGALLGVPTAEAAGRPLPEAVRQQELQALARRLLETRQRATQDLHFYQPSERRLRVHGAPCEGAGTSGPSVVLVLQDVTEAHHYDQLRRDFVANVSHELKSPLTSIRGLTETLLGGALEDSANNRRFVQLVDEDAARLAHLIEDLLSLSQIESQAVPLKIAPVALRPLIEAVAASLQAAARQRRLTVTVAVPAQALVAADPDRVRQVVTNLVDNAIKYNREGGTIGITAAPEGANWRVDIADSGIGIPPQDVPRIFERFYRVDKARSRALGGTGLGLAIVKHIVEAHGGQVAVTSRPQHGSTFSFTLPRAS
jgi:two-component system phosphate regulon sensor histidine kinase PhoR